MTLDLVRTINDDLEREAPATFRALSPLGRRVFYPPGIPHQAAEARGTTFNGTIGQITDGRGGALPLPSMSKVVRFDDAQRASRAFLYSPVDGIPALRQAWRAHQRRAVGDDVPSTLPLVTDGLTHALSIVADLFGGEGRVVASPGPFWGNYRQCFSLRTGAEIRTAPTWREGRYNHDAIAEALADVPVGEPAVAMVNAPSNPGGYMPTSAEREALIGSLLTVADDRPLVVVLDDAYAGLVFDSAVPRDSLFWELIGRHENLVPVKVDGVTKEFSFFGGRVGFVTFGVKPDSPVARALESKVKSLIRSTVGSPVSMSQMLALEALESASIEVEVEAVRVRLERRCQALHTALAAVDPSLIRPWPFNAGCFAVVEIPEGVDAEALRQHLIADHDTGIVAIPPRHVRIAFCSVAHNAIPELVKRLEIGIRELL